VIGLASIEGALIEADGLPRFVAGPVCAWLDANIDERGLLSYEAALILTKSLLRRNRGAFREFVQDAGNDDAGDAALRKHYALTYDDLIS